MRPGRIRQWGDSFFVQLLTTSIAVLGYSGIYKRNTQKPIQRIIDTVDEESMGDEIDRWAKSKLKEAQYVQVAGAVMFASTISSLSWSSISNTYWSGPALWYGSIIMALTAIALGAQQVMFLPETVDVNAARHFRLRLLADSPGKTSQPRPMMLFVWQAPLMCLSISIVLFLAGFTSIVVSPLAQHPAWNAEAKTLLLYMAVGAFAIVIFAVTSFNVHSDFEDHIGAARPDDRSLHRREA